MSRIDTVLNSLYGSSGLARGNTDAGSIDPRARLVTTMVFIIMVTSFGKYDVVGLLPFIVYPVSLASLGNISFRGIGRSLLLVCPFALFIGIFNPLLDRHIMVQIGSVGISGGWISFTTIMVKFVLTVSAALILVAADGFDALCHSMERLKVPPVFVSQLMFMHRYIHVMAHEASRMLRAHDLRSAGGKRMSMKVFGSLVGQLLLRTLDRAQRIHMAMVSRGFTGEIRIIHRLRAGLVDVIFVLAWCSFFGLARMYNLPRLLGMFVMESLL